jgi:hypothetical protein
MKPGVIVMILNIFAEKMAISTQNIDIFWQKLIMTLFSRKKPILAEKLAKIAENQDLNIDPRFSVPSAMPLRHAGHEQSQLFLC